MSIPPSKTPSSTISPATESDCADSIARLRHRLKAIRADSAHLVRKLPPDSPHNVILRLIDVARYIRASSRQLTEFSDGVHSPKWLQEELTVFFDRWDRGRLHKVKTPDGWRIEIRDQLHAALAPVAAADTAPAQAPRILRLRIDPKTMGLKVL